MHCAKTQRRLRQSLVSAEAEDCDCAVPPSCKTECVFRLTGPGTHSIASPRAASSDLRTQPAQTAVLRQRHPRRALLDAGVDDTSSPSRLENEMNEELTDEVLEMAGRLKDVAQSINKHLKDDEKVCLLFLFSPLLNGCRRCSHRGWQLLTRR